MTMKTTMSPVKWMALVTVVTSVLIGLGHRGSTGGNDQVAAEKAAPSDEVATVQQASHATPQVQAEAVVHKAAAAPAASPADASMEVVRAEMSNDLELAYQLGEDITKLSPEALARMRNDWEAHVAQSLAETAISQ